MRQKHGEEVREVSPQGDVTFWPTQLACYQSRFSHQPLTQAPCGDTVSAGALYSVCSALLSFITQRERKERNATHAINLLTC